MTHQARLSALNVDPAVLEKAHTFVRFLQRWNKAINLTSRRQSTDSLWGHVWECLWAASNCPGSYSDIADIGSGAGFPGIFFKLAHPQKRVVLIEKSQKKAVFLREVSRHLELPIEVFAEAAETFSDWGAIDLAITRGLRPAVGLLRQLASAGVDIIWLHGKPHPQPENFLVGERESVPGSSGRWLSRFQPAPEGQTTPA